MQNLIGSLFYLSILCNIQLKEGVISFLFHYQYKNNDDFIMEKTLLYEEI
jgi:hypothetical protein